MIFNCLFSIQGDQIQLVGPEQQTGIQVTLSSGIESSQHL